MERRHYASLPASTRTRKRRIDQRSVARPESRQQIIIDVVSAKHKITKHGQGSGSRKHKVVLSLTAPLSAAYSTAIIATWVIRADQRLDEAPVRGERQSRLLRCRRQQIDRVNVSHDPREPSLPISSVRSTTIGFRAPRCTMASI